MNISAQDSPVGGELLLDTGPLVALVDRSESAHGECVELARSWKGPVLTTEAVVTEALHLLGEWRYQKACFGLLAQAGVRLVSTPNEDLTILEELMERYRNVPMDYADATLVHLAGELGTSLVFTLDRKGFGIYRYQGRRPFEIRPAS